MSVKHGECVTGSMEGVGRGAQYLECGYGTKVEDLREEQCSENEVMRHRD